MYRKFSADNIFTGYSFTGAGHVLITKNDGEIIDLISAADAGDDVQQYKGIISPGFINAHCHLELSHMKGHIPQHTGLVDFVFKIISERHFSNEEIVAAIEAADDEMYANGIVAVGDICNNLSTLPQKQKTKLRYHNFIEASGFPPAIAGMRFQRSVELYMQYSNVTSSATSIVPHAPYSVSPQLFARINDFQNNKVLSIHNQETSEENELFLNGTGDFLRLFEQLNIDISFFAGTGKTSMQTYLPFLDKYESLILVHNVHTSEKDILFQRQLSAHRPEAAVFYCLCPNANLYITDQLPDLRLFTQPLPGSAADKPVAALVLGTDSLASNHQLSICEEMKILQQRFPFLSVALLLQWATSNGARALQMEDDLGSFDKGKKPGVVLIENANDQHLLADAASKRLL